jgi:hypothetical protein
MFREGRKEKEVSSKACLEKGERNRRYLLKACLEKGNSRYFLSNVFFRNFFL